MTSLLQILANGLALGSVYALFASGYTLIFSVLGIINFAHGALMTLGAYAALTIWNTKPDLGFVFVLLLTMLFCALVNIGIGRVAFQTLRKKGAENWVSLVSGLGVGLVLVNGIQIIFGAESRSFPVDPLAHFPPLLIWGEVRMRTIQFFLMFVSIFVLTLLSICVKFSSWGRKLRAVAENETAATLVGIPVARTLDSAFAIAGALAGLAGVLLALNFGIPGPYFGMTYGLKGLAVVVLGGMGQIGGTCVAGFLLGMAEAFLPADLSAYRDAVSFALLFAVLVVRPQGLFGRSGHQKV